MNDAPRQTLRELIARHGPGLCSDARRCEGLLRDLCGEHRREINILVSALKERVPLDLLAAQSAMPRGLLVARLAKRLEDHLALTGEAARWAVDSWALALGVVTEAEVAEREEKAEREKKAAPPPPPTSANAPRPVSEEVTGEAGKIRATQSQTTRPAPPPPQRQQQGAQPAARAATPAPKTSPPPPVVRPPGRQSPPAPSPKTSWPPPSPWSRTWFPVRRRSAAAQANTKTPTGGALPSPAPTQDPSTRGRGRTLRGCTAGCLLLVLLTLALVFGGPFVLSVLREEQERRNLEPSPVLSP
jgi:hypothetical protein